MRALLCIWLDGSCYSTGWTRMEASTMADCGRGNQQSRHLRSTFTVSLLSLKQVGSKARFSRPDSTSGSSMHQFQGKTDKKHGKSWRIHDGGRKKAVVAIPGPVIDPVRMMRTLDQTDASRRDIYGLSIYRSTIKLGNYLVHPMEVEKVKAHQYAEKF
ncbi:hypothetical protein B0H14DRAFT_3158120 [Mycena olivaceomarginata]|nr:hypothetical protein B0H14DRAFT_3158120 [Mycena olivaceomarginata]